MLFPEILSAGKNRHSIIVGMIVYLFFKRALKIIARKLKNSVVQNSFRTHSY
jgi:hypothetical protein